MRVERIEQYTASKLKVYLEDGIAFVLYKGDLRKYHISTERELSEEEIAELCEQMKKRAKMRSLKLLQQKDYTRKQLTDKLLRDGYPETVVEEAISYIDSYGYLNDEFYAQEYARSRLQRKSRRNVIMELKQRGIHSRETEEIIYKLEQEGLIPPEEDVVAIYLNKKHFNNQMSYEEQRKIVQYCLQKGFSSESIENAIKNY